MLWGHRFLPSDLTEAEDKVIFRVSFFVREPGNYELQIYKGTTTSSVYELPATLLASKAVSTTKIGWFDIDLEAPVTIDKSQDLWVFIYDPEAKNMPAEFCYYDEHNRGSYLSYDITSWTLTYDGVAWLIRTCLTDGTYTYNLYQDGVMIADSLTETSYSVTLNDNAANLFTLTTNYYGGETRHSNWAGFAKGNVSVNTLEIGPNDMMTLSENSILTVTDSLSNSNPDQLIIEDGGQLIHHNDGVQATFKKNISAYADNNGWYTISTPFTSFDHAQLAYDNFDLYAYDEDGDTIGMEWINFKAGNFNPDTGHGYIYAHKPSTTLRLTGTLNNGDDPFTVNLGFGNAHDDIKGFNLVGNHTAHDIAFSKSADVADGYYFLDNSDTWAFEPGNCVPPGRAFLVKANAQGQTITLNPDSKALNETQPLIRIDLDGDQAFVKLSDGVDMPLLDLRGRHACVYLNRDGKDFILLATDHNEDINLRCQPRQKGRHLLTFTVENANIGYLHLIDHLTGTDVDLLKNPTYSFVSDDSDCGSRFQLVRNGNENQKNISK